LLVRLSESGLPPRFGRLQSPSPRSTISPSLHTPYPVSADFPPSPVTLNAATFATLREIEGRLKSIRNIEKITKTMKIVASTKLNRAQRAMTESRSYGKTSNTVFDNAETRALDGEGKKTLFIVASSDKGLCGSIHSGLSKMVRRKLVENPNAHIVCIGEKSKAQLSRSSGKNIVLSFAGVGRDIPTFAEAQAIADQISQLPGKYENIEIIYNSFVSAVSYEPRSIEAFSEEAIASSRMYPYSTVARLPSAYCLGELPVVWVTADVPKPTSRPLRSTTRCSLIYGNTLLQTACTG
jgi:hypothetical protein